MTGQLHEEKKLLTWLLLVDWIYGEFNQMAWGTQNARLDHIVTTYYGIVWFCYSPLFFSHQFCLFQSLKLGNDLKSVYAGCVIQWWSHVWCHDWIPRILGNSSLVILQYALHTSNAMQVYIIYKIAVSFMHVDAWIITIPLLASYMMQAGLNTWVTAQLLGNLQDNKVCVHHYNCVVCPLAAI